MGIHKHVQRHHLYSTSTDIDNADYRGGRKRRFSNKYLCKKDTHTVMCIDVDTLNRCKRGKSNIYTAAHRTYRISQESFGSFFVSIVKVSVMLVGEFEYKEVFVDSINQFKAPGRSLNPFPNTAFVFCCIFILLMAVVLINLLVSRAIFLAPSVLCSHQLFLIYFLHIH